MKRLLIIGLLSCLVSVINAQTIHWLTFIDTTDENVGELDVLGRKVLYNRFINVINAALAEKGVISDIQDFYGERTTPENCKRAIESLTCQSDDMIVFYYIGHGGRPILDDDSQHPFPHMWLAQSDERKMIPLEWVHNTLKSKGARMTVSIGMCCNVKQNLSIKRAPTFGVNYGNTYLSQNQLDAIQNMFLGYQGDFILSSASPGQSSYGCFTPLGNMDLFTATLVTLFEKNASKNTLVWNSLFSDVKNSINNETGNKQTAFFSSNLSKVSVTHPESKRGEPAQKTIDVRNVTDVGNILTMNIDFIVDSRQKADRRIIAAENLKQMFIENAQIKILGQDGEIVVDKENIEDFLGRLATSRILLKVVPISYKASGNQISELSVREYYKK